MMKCIFKQWYFVSWYKFIMVLWCIAKPSCCKTKKVIL